MAHDELQQLNRELERALGFKDEALIREQVAREMAQAAQYRLEFLAEASALLSSSLDYAETLQRVARLAVPFLADWCVFDIVEDGGNMRRVAIAHEDAKMEALAKTFQEEYQPDPTRIKGIMRVLRTGQAELIPEVNDKMLAEVARDPQHLNALKAAGAHSVMIVPLVTRNRSIGVLTLATARSGRTYGHSHLAIAEDLARRAAQAVDNALLYRTAQEELDERIRVEQELRRHQEEIEALNERLTMAMMETHHRVKNNLQLISAMIDLRVLDEPETIPIADLVRLGKSVKTLASVHELLTAGAKDGNSNLLPANAVLEQIIPMVKSSAPGREVSFQADEVLLSTRQGTSLALIANELASNAIKYGSSRVGIHLRAVDGRAELEVSDDGPGFPDGFNARKAANTGLDMVESLTKWDLVGKSSYDNHPDGGARVTITFVPPSGD